MCKSSLIFTTFKIRKAVAEIKINRQQKIDNRPPFVNSAASVKVQKEWERREMIEQKKLARKSAPSGSDF